VPDLLVELIGRTEDLTIEVKKWTIRTGTALVQDTDKEAALVQNLLDLKEKLDAILSGAFQSHEGFARVSSADSVPLTLGTPLRGSSGVSACQAAST
jgi:hypothetical protein